MIQLSEQKCAPVTGGILAGQTWLTSRSYTWPLVSCIVSADGVTLTTCSPPRFHFRVPKESIRELVIKDYGIAGFLKIIHDLQELPPYIRFGIFDVSKLKKALVEFHYL